MKEEGELGRGVEESAARTGEKKRTTTSSRKGEAEIKTNKGAKGGREWRRWERSGKARARR